MTKQQKKAKNALTDRMLVNYFGGFSRENSHFIIEHKIASQVVDIIASKEYLSKKEFAHIVKCFNQIVGEKHYDGSGWEDFRLRLRWFCRAFGYEASFDAQTDELKIAKASWLQLIEWWWQRVTRTAK